MSVGNKNDKKLVKIIILSAGVILVGGGLGPTLLDYFSEDNSEISSESNILSAEVDQRELDSQASVAKPKISNNKKIEIEKKPSVHEKSNTEITFKSLPLLHESDQFVFDEFIPKQNKEIFVDTDLINNMVVFVNNFSRGELVTNFSPLVHPKAPFLVQKQDGVMTIDDRSYQRYDTYADTISEINVDNIIDIYSYLSPLFDQAHQEVGYPKGTFTDTLQVAINKVLDTPILHYKAELISPEAIYQYKDENLESLPNTQKLMLRMGPDNLQKVQKKLAEILNELQHL